MPENALSEAKRLSGIQRLALKATGFRVAFHFARNDREIKLKGLVVF